MADNATTHNEIVNPVTGERVVFRDGVGDPTAARLSMDFYLKPSGGVFVPHLHRQQREVLHVRSGTLKCTFTDGERLVTAGESVTIEPGVGHSLLNAGTEELHAYVEFTPALGAEAFLRNYFGLCSDGKSNDKGDLPLLHLAVFMPTYGNYRGDIPLLAQRILFFVLRPIGKLLGYRASYPKYMGAQRAA